MAAFHIDKDIEAIGQSIAQDNIGRLIGCVESYFKTYTDMAVADHIENLRAAHKEDEITDFNNNLPQYRILVDKGVKVLNEYIENNFGNFIVIEKKKLFLSVAKTLINLGKISIANVDANEFVKVLLKFLSTASQGDEEIFNQIYETLTISFDTDDKNTDDPPIKRIWIAEHFSDSDFLMKLLRNSQGRNYKFLKDISNKINNDPISTKIDDYKDDKLTCRIMNGECNQFIPAGKYYFIAFPFSEKGIEDKIIEALKHKFSDLEPKIARGVLENKMALCQICQFILSSKFGIYVLNKYTSDGTRYLPNSNVTLELGLAMGHRKKYIMLVEKDAEIISDLQGLLRIPYDNPDDIPKVIEQHNFGNFHREEN